MAHAHGNAVPEGMTGDPQLGEMLGPYRVDGVAGRGGMASVYSAIDTRDGEKVAVKLLKPLHDPDRIQGFRREFRALKRLPRTTRHRYAS